MSARRDPSVFGVRYSLHGGLPATFASDGFTQRFVAGLDQVLAPVHAVSDDLEAYLDPQMCPPDFLEWLAGWFGVQPDAHWPIKRRREFVAAAVRAYEKQGTCEGIALAVELYTGVRPVVTDSGGVSASPVPQGEMPGSPWRTVSVGIDRDFEDQIDLDVVDRIVEGCKPALIEHEVRFTGESRAF